MQVTPRLPLSLVAAAVVVLNLADGMFTLAYLHAGVAAEANPVMRGALDHGPVGFMAIKLALVSLAVLLLFRLHHRRAAAHALVGSALAYSTLVVYHLSALPRVL